MFCVLADGEHYIAVLVFFSLSANDSITVILEKQSNEFVKNKIAARF